MHNGLEVVPVASAYRLESLVNTFILFLTTAISLPSSTENHFGNKMTFLPEPEPPSGRNPDRLRFPSDLVASILDWTPEILLDEHHYDGDVQELPHLPQLQSVEAWKSAYKPAMRVEMHSALCQAIQRPDKLVRKMRFTDIDDAIIKSDSKSLGERGVVLKFSFLEDPGLRSQDFVYISPLSKPWEETAAMCAPGIVHAANFHEELAYVKSTATQIQRKRWDASVEVSRGYADALEMLGAGGRLKIILISSIASGYRIFRALCDPEHSELLIQRILQPSPLVDSASSAIHPRHAQVIESLAT